MTATASLIFMCDETTGRIEHVGIYSSADLPIVTPWFPVRPSFRSATATAATFALACDELRGAIKPYAQWFRGPMRTALQKLADGESDAMVDWGPQ